MEHVYRQRDLEKSLIVEPSKGQGGPEPLDLESGVVVIDIPARPGPDGVDPTPTPTPPPDPLPPDLQNRPVTDSGWSGWKFRPLTGWVDAGWLTFRIGQWPILVGPAGSFGH
nr:hypothetical protein [Tessaracoccus coleopterorum]